MSITNPLPVPVIGALAEPVFEPASESIFYPESDGKPMADNTKQFHQIVTIEGNLEILFADNPDVFVAGDLLWYPIEGSTNISAAPDVMVALGRPKGDRGSYLQWREGHIAPQVVFEILSPRNTEQEMSKKLEFYNRYGVEEYYLYDPDSGRLAGWQRAAGRLVDIEEMIGWRSPRLGIQFDLDGIDLQLYYPDGRSFVQFVELEEQRKIEAAARQKAEEAAQAEATARQKAEAQLREYEAKLRAAGLL